MSLNRMAVRGGRVSMAALAIMLTIAGARHLRSLAAAKSSPPDGDPEDRSDSFAAGLAIPVEADTVRRGTLVLGITATGQIEGERRATIAPQLAGMVRSVSVQEGDFVPAARVLVELDQEESALAVERARAAYGEALARYRALTLFDEEIDDPEVRIRRANAARAWSGLEVAEVALRQAELTLAHCTVKAPFAGRVADIRVTVGEHVAPGEDLLTLVDLDPVRVEVQVIESQLRWLRRGSRAAVRLAAFPDSILRGRVTAISPSVDPRTRTARVTIVLTNPDGVVLPGMFARVTLEGRAFPNRLLVPREAIVERDGRTLVFQFVPSPREPSENGLARWVYVDTGLADGRNVELVERDQAHPLKPGDLVLVGGHLTLVHDARVHIGLPSGSRGP